MARTYGMIIAMDLKDFIPYYMDQFRTISLDAQIDYEQAQSFCVYLRKTTAVQDRGVSSGEEMDDLGNASDPELHTQQRNWAIKKPLARPKSAKGNRTDFSTEKPYKDFLMGDMISSLKQKTSKKANKKITVPKSYNFEQREKTRPKTITQKKFEDFLDQKEMEIKKYENWNFKAKEVPPDVTIPK